MFCAPPPGQFVDYNKPYIVSSRADRDDGVGVYSITLPTTRQANDICLVFTTQTDNDNVITATDGFTDWEPGIGNRRSGLNSQIFYKVLTGSEPTTMSWTGSDVGATRVVLYCVIVIRGCLGNFDDVTKIDKASTTNSSAFNIPSNSISDDRVRHRVWVGWAGCDGDWATGSQKYPNDMPWARVEDFWNFPSPDIGVIQAANIYLSNSQNPGSFQTAGSTREGSIYCGLVW